MNSLVHGLCFVVSFLLDTDLPTPAEIGFPRISKELVHFEFGCEGISEGVIAKRIRSL